MSWLLALFICAAPKAADWVDVGKAMPGVILDIRYATADNFTGVVLYPKARCLLRKAAFDKLSRAQAWLDSHAPGHTLVLKDCYRPLSVQKKMWEKVAGTKVQGYVADPSKGSVHNYGAAVDVSLAKDGKELDMGTPYDFLGRLAQPRYEDEFVASGKLTAAQVANRRLLRQAMAEGGDFRTIKNEWWHFDAFRSGALTSRFTIEDFGLDAELAP